MELNILGNSVCEFIIDKNGNPYSCKVLDADDFTINLLDLKENYQNNCLFSTLFPNITESFFIEIYTLLKEGKSIQFTSFSEIKRKFFQFTAKLISENKFLLLLSEKVDDFGQNTRFKNIIETSRDGFWIVNCNAVIMMVNNYYSKTSGYSSEELIGMRISDLDVDKNDEEILELVKDIKEKGHETFISRHRTKNGDIINVVVNVTYSGETFNEFYVFIRNITDELEANEKLIASELRYKLATAASDNGIWDWFTDSDEVYYSDQWKAQIGYEPNELENNFSTWANQLHPDDYNRMLNEVDNFLTYPKEFFIAEFRFRHKNGSYKWIRNRAKAVINHKGKVIRMFGAHNDITEQKNAESKLKELIASRDKLFSIISHDLKSPFQSLLGSSELIITDINSISQEEISLLSGQIHSSLEGLYKLIENLLDWTRFQSGKIQYSPIEFNISETANGIIKIFELAAARKKIKIFSEIEKDLTVFADEHMISSILRNLLSNCVKFTNYEGLVNFTVKSDIKVLSIIIEDDGIGMDIQDVEKFNSGENLLSTLGTSQETGTGLGLSLVKEFILVHKGNIKISSIKYEGTKIIITLPILI